MSIQMAPKLFHLLNIYGVSTSWRSTILIGSKTCLKAMNTS